MEKRQVRWIGWTVLFFLLLSTSQIQAQDKGSALSVSYVAVNENADQLDLNVYFSVQDSDGEGIPQPSINNAFIQLLGSNNEPVSASITKPETPIYIVLLIDGSGSMREVMPDVKMAARAAIDQAPANALFSVIQFDEGINVIEEFTDNHERVKAAISEVSSQSDKGTCLYDAAFEAIGRIDREITSHLAQRAVILFTDGQDQLRQNDPAPCSVHTLSEVTRSARPTDVTQPSTPIHTIGLFGRKGNNNINQNELAQLARDTYGFSAFGNVSQLDRLFERIMNGLNSQLVASVSLFAQSGINQATLSVKTQNDAPALTATFNFPAKFAHDTPPDPISAIDNGLTDDFGNQQVIFSVGLNNAQQIEQLIIRIENEASSKKALDDIIIDNPSSAVEIQIDTTKLEPEQDYLIKVSALDANQQIIASADGKNILLEKSFTHNALEAVAFNFTIDTVNVDYQTGLFTMTVTISDPEIVQSYTGFISDKDAGSNLHEFGPIAFTNIENKKSVKIAELLPSSIQTDPTQKDYELILKFKIWDAVNGDLLDIVQVREFSPIPPVEKGRIQKLKDKLGENPFILYAILAVPVGVYLLLRWKKKQAQAKIIKGKRPPVEPALFADPIFQGAQRKVEDEGFDSLVESSPTPHPGLQSIPTQRLGEPRQSASAGTHANHRLKVRILRLPKEELITTRVFTTFPLIIGREQAALLITHDHFVSRQHVEIGVENGNYYIKDLSSKSGVRVNGKQIPAGRKVKLPRKAQIKLSSKTMLKLELG